MKSMENTKMKIKREIGTVGVGTGLNAEERLSLVHLLIKAGYACRISRRKVSDRVGYAYFVEYWEE